MTTPTGTISLNDVQTEFGGSNPIAINEYYAGGLYVPAGMAGVPSSKFLVSAPFHFYFGIIKGSSALDKFKAKYIADE